jgi:hypothetical protein
MNSIMGKAGIQRFKIICRYFITFFFISWLQIIANAVLFPVGGGEYHFLFQIRETPGSEGFYSLIVPVDARWVLYAF